MRAHHVPVIGRERDQRIAGLAGLVQRVENAAHLRVHLFDVRVVVRAALADIVFRDLAPGLRFAAVQSGLSGEGIGETLRHGNRSRIVAVQVLLQGQVRIVRFNQVHLQMPRLIAFCKPAHHLDGQVGQIMLLGRLLVGPSR